MKIVPEIRFARATGSSIAYMVYGDGPVTICAVPPMAQNVELAWGSPVIRRMFERYATFSRQVAFDKRGTGMSDRELDIPGLDERVDELRAVMDDAGIAHAYVHGSSEGGPMAIMYAATYPERVDGLILEGTAASLVTDADRDAVAADDRPSELRRRFVSGWGTPDSITVGHFAPSLADEIERFTTGAVRDRPPTVDHRVEVRTLGEFEVVVDGAPVATSEWGSKRARTLLKRLVAAQGWPVTRDELIELLWPGELSDRLGARLSVQLSAVRRVLHGGVVADRSTVRLDLESVDVDLTRWSALADDVAIVDGYAGDFLPDDVYEDWSAASRDEARSRFVTSARRVIERAQSEGDHVRPESLLRRILVADAYDVPAHRALIAGDSATRMSAIEFTAPRGFGPSLHVHREEDEIMYVIDGEIRLDLGGGSHVVAAGAVVLLPHGIPHVFQVLSAEARFLTVTSGGTAHPTFDTFVRAIGVPTDPQALPAPVEIDPGLVAQVCAQHGIEVLGPPPAPLD